MFIKEVTVPRKNSPPVKYVQIVESVRRPGSRSPRHQVILNLGRADRIDRQRLRRLIRLLNGYLQQPDQHPLPDEVEIGQTRQLGVPYLIENLWQKLGLRTFFRAQLKRRKIEFPVERALLAMVAHRAVDPSSKRRDFYWLRNDAFFPWGRKIELHHLYRALDFLQEHRDALEDTLYAHRRDLFNGAAELIYFDTTTVHFEVEDDPEEPPVEGLRQYGRPKDGRTSHRRIVVGMAVDPEGLPLLSHTFPGHTADSQTIATVLARLKAMGVNRVVFVADRGCVSLANLKSIRAAGMDYIVGLRLRRAGSLMPTILADKTPYQKVADNLLAKAVQLDDRRLVVCYSPESAARDTKMRGRALERLNAKLAAVDQARDRHRAEAEILAHKLFRRWVERDAGGRLLLSREKVAAEADCDGTFVLETSNPQLSPSQVALGYKNLLRVERAWQSLKHVLDIQPVFLRNDERIAAHVTLCTIAYLLERWAELKTGQSFREIRRRLNALHATELIGGGQRLWKGNRLEDEQRALWKKLEVPPPRKVLSTNPLPRLPAEQM